MVMRWIMQDWVSRLVWLRERLCRREREPDAWFLRIRERILVFLIARYGEEPMETREQTGAGESGLPVRVARLRLGRNLFGEEISYLSQDGRRMGRRRSFLC